MRFQDSSQPAETPRVLVVDDEKVIREILADFLTLEGFRVTTAADGIGALEHLDSDTFNMVISDLKMPNMGGLELLEQAHAGDLLDGPELGRLRPQGAGDRLA